MMSDNLTATAKAYLMRAPDAPSMATSIPDEPGYKMRMVSVNRSARVLVIETPFKHASGEKKYVTFAYSQIGLAGTIGGVGDGPAVEKYANILTDEEWREVLMLMQRLVVRAEADTVED